MHIRCSSKPILGLLGAFALAACANEAPANVETDAAVSTETTDVDVQVSGPERHILAFGDSLFAGYNVPDGDSYPAKLQAALRGQGINAQVTNAGISGDTSAAGLQRLEFLLDSLSEKPDLFILELGGNDLLRGISPEQTRANLAAMLEEAQSRDIPVLIMGMRAPPNYGPEFQQQFDGLYASLAEEYDAELVPFWLESIYQDPSLFQSDRIHPTVEGIERLVEDTADDVMAALPAEEPAAG